MASPALLSWVIWLESHDLILTERSRTVGFSMADFLKGLLMGRGAVDREHVETVVIYKIRGVLSKHRYIHKPPTVANYGHAVSQSHLLRRGSTQR